MEKLKYFFKSLKYSNIVFAILLTYIAYTRFPVIYENSKLEGNSFDDRVVVMLNGEQNYLSEFPEKKIFVFWASWCAPCRFEMSRFNDSLKGKEIPYKNIFFVNMGEQVHTVKKFLEIKDYDFQVIMDQDGKLAETFSVSGTPTVIHANQFVVKKVSMGISPLGIYSAKSFFANSK